MSDDELKAIVEAWIRHLAYSTVNKDEVIDLARRVAEAEREAYARELIAELERMRRFFRDDRNLSAVQAINDRLAELREAKQ